MIVLDASAVIAYLLNRPPGSTDAIRARLQAPGGEPCAPHLIDLEIAHTLRRLLLRRELSVDRASEALQDLARLAIDRYPHYPLMVRIWELRENVTAYDAAYVALAEDLDAPLLTRDVRLSRAPHRARVEVV